MKRYLTVLILLCSVGCAEGVYFSYYAGGFRAFCKVHAADLLYSAGPFTDDQYGMNFVSVEKQAQIPYTYGYSYNDMGSQKSTDSICLRSLSIADMTASDAWSYAYGYGYGRTEDTQTYGIFFRILPDAGQNYGDDVVVYYSDTLNILASGETLVYVGGIKGMDHLAITRGQLPPGLTEPNSANEVLTFDNLELTDAGGYWFSGVLSFPAQIGDVIGIFAENYTDVVGYGPLASWAQSEFTIVLSIKPILAGDLDDDGDVDFYDVAKLAQNWLVGTTESVEAETSRGTTSSSIKRHRRATIPLCVDKPTDPREN